MVLLNIINDLGLRKIKICTHNENTSFSMQNIVNFLDAKNNLGMFRG